MWTAGRNVGWQKGGHVCQQASGRKEAGWKVPIRTDQLDSISVFPTDR